MGVQTRLAENSPKTLFENGVADLFVEFAQHLPEPSSATDRSHQQESACDIVQYHQSLLSGIDDQSPERGEARRHSDVQQRSGHRRYC